MRIIELFEKEYREGMVYLIAECNEYKDGVIIKQLSRSPFVFPDTMTDEEIISSISQGDYKKFF
jgi:hypothetical protein